MKAKTVFKKNPAAFFAAGFFLSGANNIKDR